MKHFYDYYNTYRDTAERRADAAIAALGDQWTVQAPRPWLSFCWDGDHRSIPSWAAADAYDLAIDPGALFVTTRLVGEMRVRKGDVVYEFDLKRAFDERRAAAERCHYAFP